MPPAKVSKEALDQVIQKLSNSLSEEGAGYFDFVQTKRILNALQEVEGLSPDQTKTIQKLAQNFSQQHLEKIKKHLEPEIKKEIKKKEIK